jgi:N-methylhydantoinase B
VVGADARAAIACSFNLEYLLVGGRDARRKDRPIFMWYDWMVGGWGGRNGKDGSNATAPIFGVGSPSSRSRRRSGLCPVLTTGHEIRTDSAGPGKFRGGCGVEKGAHLREAENTVMSYMCDRARSITWGIQGGLPSMPHGVWLNKDTDGERFLGAVFSGVPVVSGDVFTRPAAGGGGFGDPLERDVEAVLDDVADGYVTIDRACKDYGVVVTEVDADLAEYEVDEEATARERERLREGRLGRLEEDPDSVAERYRDGELDVLDSFGTTGSSSTGTAARCFRRRRSSSARCSAGG